MPTTCRECGYPFREHTFVHGSGWVCPTGALEDTEPETDEP